MNETKSPFTVQEVWDSLAFDDRGRVKNTIENCLFALENDPDLAGRIRKNLLSGMTMIEGPVPWNEHGGIMTDNDENYIYLLLESRYQLTVDRKIGRAIGIVADENSYHPIRDYLSGLKWDGQERIRYVLHHFLGAPTDDLTYAGMRIFLLGAISRVFRIGTKFEYMLCLIGDQGAGKSTFFRFLALKDEWFSDDLKRLDDDNIFRKLQGHWIVEMGEMLAAMNAKNAEVIKAFLSRQKDTYKIPYDRHPQDFQRQCVFGGTSNKDHFLPFDRSGNRRFIPVRVNSKKAEAHILADEEASRAYMEQVYAEAMEIYRSGNFTLSFTQEQEERLDRLRENYMSEDDDAETIRAWLEDYTGEFVCCKQLYRDALKHMLGDPKKWESDDIADIMDHHVSGWERGPLHRFPNYGTCRSWVRVEQEESTCNVERPPAGQKDPPPVEQMTFMELEDEGELPF